MGNNRFRLSDMIPNAWFHKLKDMTKTKNHVKNNNADRSKKKPKPKESQNFNQRKSYYFTRDLIPIDGLYVSKDPARKSSNKRYSPRKNNLRSPPKVATSSVSAGCRCRETICSKPDSPPPEYSASSSSFSFFDDQDSSSQPELIKPELELELPPIITKPAKFNDMVDDIKKKKQSMAPKITSNNNKHGGPVRKFGAHSPGVRLRVNSPKIRSKKNQGLARKSVSSSTSLSSSLSESFAVVKSSFDPRRDFRESMVEMILEKNIRSSKDLEDLLACYLSLNSNEYHDLIINVFKQIWFDLSDVQIKS